MKRIWIRIGLGALLVVCAGAFLLMAAAFGLSLWYQPEEPILLDSIIADKESWETPHEKVFHTIDATPTLLGSLTVPAEKFEFEPYFHPEKAKVLFKVFLGKEPEVLFSFLGNDSEWIPLADDPLLEEIFADDPEDSLFCAVWGRKLERVVLYENVYMLYSSFTLEDQGYGRTMWLGSHKPAILTFSEDYEENTLYLYKMTEETASLPQLTVKALWRYEEEERLARQALFVKHEEGEGK